MAIVLLDFVGKALRVAKQALGKHAGKPESGGLPREAHIVAHCIRKEEDHTFTELVDRIGLMPEVCELLGLHPDALPDPTTFYHSLDRYAMYVWRALLRVSAQQLPQSGHVALDSTFFERKQASQYYLQRSGRTVKTIKATTPTDTESLAVLDVHCCIKREHDTKAGPRVIRRNADDLRSVAADSGFQDWHSPQIITRSATTVATPNASSSRTSFPGNKNGFEVCGVLDLPDSGSEFRNVILAWIEHEVVHGFPILVVLIPDLVGALAVLALDFSAFLDRLFVANLAHACANYPGGLSSLASFSASK